jgi:hypothetical protein
VQVHQRAHGACRQAVGEEEGLPRQRESLHCVEEIGAAEEERAVRVRSEKKKTEWRSLEIGLDHLLTYLVGAFLFEMMI